jgi:glucose-6-phosphate 1-dehydrogenase
VEQSWRFADSVRRRMEQTALFVYRPDGWGPAAADTLFADCEGRWTRG